MPQATLVGSSPEIMVRVVAGKVTVRPLAGTRRRGGATDEEDRRLAEELLADPEGTGRARDARRPGPQRRGPRGPLRVGRSQRRNDDRALQPRDAHHVERHRPVGRRPRRVRRPAACLPAGTVSGAPKVRAMQIIDELEPHRRGPYAGAVGYVDFNGNMDTCIALRTIVVQGQQGLRASRGRHRRRQRAERANTRKRSTRPEACSRPSS